MSEVHDHPAAIDPDELLRACRVTRERASGPGGQHRNKVETAVTLLHTKTGVSSCASERRSQAENQHVAMKRLRLNLALNVRREAGTLHTPSTLWRSRTRDRRIVISAQHADFPAILAEALDVLAAHGYDPKAAVTVLGCSRSQLIKLLKAEPRAFAMLNEKRRESGLRNLK